MQGKLRRPIDFVVKRSLKTDVWICHQGRAPEENGQGNHQKQGASWEQITHLNMCMNPFLKTDKKEEAQDNGFRKTEYQK